MERWGQSAWHSSLYLPVAMVALGLTLGVGAHSRAAFAVSCVGDCNGDGKVTVDETIAIAAIELGDEPVTACSAGVIGSTVGIDQVVRAANNEISGECVDVFSICGNGLVDPGEECDIGGTCIGNADAGKHCTSDADCGGSTVGGVCEGGDRGGAACGSLSDCPNGNCVRCKVFEGKTLDGAGCAANCTLETGVVLDLVPGQRDPNTPIAPGTSGAVVYGAADSLALPIGNSCVGGAHAGQPCTAAGDCPQGVCTPATQIFGVGKARGDGVIPLVIKSASVRFPQIDIGGPACACARGVSQKSCGGTVFEADGITETPFCTANFGNCDSTGHCAQLPSVSCAKNTDCEGDTFCTAAQRNPCAFVHGAGNSASGFAGCSAAGLHGVNYLYTRDAGGCDNPPACTKRTPKAPIIVFSGTGPAGSAILLNTTAIGTTVGACSGTDVNVYGQDGQFCTDDDPQKSRGTPQTIPLTTGQASSEVFNANFAPADTCNTTAGHCNEKTAVACTMTSDCSITVCDAGPQQNQCIPYATQGTPFSCSALGSGQFPGGGLVSAFVSLGQPLFQDIAVVSQFFAQPFE